MLSLAFFINNLKTGTNDLLCQQAASKESAERYNLNWLLAKLTVMCRHDTGPCDCFIYLTAVFTFLQ